MYQVICERCGTLHKTISDEEAKTWRLLPEEIEDHMIIAPHYGCPVCAYNEMLEREQELFEKKRTPKTLMTKEERENRHRIKSYKRKKQEYKYRYEEVEV